MLLNLDDLVHIPVSNTKICYNLCRRLSLKGGKDECAEKLSLEAYRLYRTVQSIIQTKEPDLVQHLTPCYSSLFEKNSNSSVSTAIF